MPINKKEKYSSIGRNIHFWRTEIPKLEVISDNIINDVAEKINKNHLFSLEWFSINFSSLNFSKLNKEIIKINNKNKLSIDQIRDNRLWAS